MRKGIEYYVEKTAEAKAALQEYVPEVSLQSTGDWELKEADEPALKAATSGPRKEEKGRQLNDPPRPRLDLRAIPRSLVIIRRQRSCDRHLGCRFGCSGQGRVGLDGRVHGLDAVGAGVRPAEDGPIPQPCLRFRTLAGAANPP